MKNEVRPIDANALAKRIREYMDNFPYAGTRLATCRVVLSMLGDEGQTPTLTDHFPGLTKMVPLTVEELRGMDGQPVWIAESPDWGHWELSEDAEDYLCDRDTDLYGLTYPDPDGKAGLHKLGWVAYAYPPAHIDREAWEPCEECEERNCDNCLYSEYLSSMEPCKSCYNAKKWKPIKKFCGECGRPLTEDAWAELEKRMGVR